MRKLITFSLSLLISSLSYSALHIRDLDGDWSNGHEGVYDDVLDITWLADANLAATNSFGLSGISTYHTGYATLSGHYYGGKYFLLPSALDYILAANNHNGSGYLGYSNWRLPTITPLVEGQYIRAGSTLDGVNTHLYNGSADEGFNITAPVTIFNPTGASEGETRNELAYHYYNNFQAKASSSGDNINGAPEYIWSDTIFGLENADNISAVNLFSNLNENDYYWTDFYTGGNSNGWLALKMETGQTLGRGYNQALQVWLVHDGDIGLAPVPIPATAWLFGSGLCALMASRRKVKTAQKD